MRLVAAVLALLGAVITLSLPAGAQEPTTPADDDSADTTEVQPFVVVEVSGLLDPIEVSYIRQQLAEAESVNAVAFVLQVNSPGDAVSDDELLELLDDLEATDVPVATWVGQSGAKATGGAAHLATVGDFAAMSTRAKIGDFGDLDNPRIAGFETYRDQTAGVDEAIEIGLVDALAPTLGELLLIMEAEGVVSGVSEAVPDQPGRFTIKDQFPAQFVKLSLTDQLFHTVASPAVAYLLLLVGLSMILLDFYTGGIGVAGGVGVICLLLSAYGLGVLDIRVWALVVLVVAMLGFAVDLQTGIPRFWTAAGTVMLVVGSFWLYDGHSLSWITLLAGIGLTLAFIFSGMPALIRTRYGTTTLGREWMIGRMAEASTDIDPEGLIVLEGAQWRARVNRLTPLRAGEPARVVKLEGLVVEVEPEEGGAIDYRQMRGKRSKGDDTSPDDGAAADDASEGAGDTA